MRAIVALGVLAAACGSSGGGGGSGGERIRRSKDAGAAVGVVARPGVDDVVERPPEREPNDDPATAAPLAGGVKGSLDGEDDIDAFTITPAAAGMIYAQVTGVEGVDLKLVLRDHRFALVVTADRGGAGVAEILPNAPVDAGTYLLVVREIPRKRKKPAKPTDAGPAGRVGPSAPYQLTASVLPAPAAGAEREPNDDEGTATELALGENATGWIGWGGDVDTWKLAIEALSEGNGLDVNVAAIEGTALTLEVTDAAGRSVMKSTGAAGQAVAVKSLAPRLTAGMAAVHHVRVSGKPANPEQAYTLTIATRLLDLDEEAEPNDRTSQSNGLRFGVEDQGSMRGEIGPGDVDIFSLSASPSAATFDVAIDPPPGVDVAIEAIAENGSSLGKADRGTAGASETLSVGAPAGTLVYVKLTAKADKTPRAGAPYQLRWSLTGGGAPSPRTPPTDEDPLPPEE
jgi:hypothetical protein